MVKVRQDAWSHEDDLLLAETVLRHIRDGSTQLNAFDEVGDKLNRTSAACGFRWNAEIRQKYDHAISLAKRQRKEKKRAMAANKDIDSVTVSPPLPVNLNDETPETKQPLMENNSNSVLEQLESSTSKQGQPSIDLDSVIEYLQTINADYQASNQSKAMVNQLETDNTKLRQHITKLEHDLTQTQSKLETIQEDYHVFMQIMDRARKMTAFENQDQLASPAFRMDKNGNLQQIAQSPNQ